MGAETFWHKVKGFIGEFAWRIYLWSGGWTEEQYFNILDESYERSGWIRP